MRIGLALLCAAGATSASLAADIPMKAPAAPAAVVANAWSATFASEVRYYSWVGARGSPTTVNAASGRGSQLYVPFALQLTGTPAEAVRVQFLARGGWVRSSQTTAGLSGTVETMTDTVLSGTVTYLGTGVQPFVSINVNAPTGKAALFGSAANARMDPDLVEIGSFGEGWNVGPTVGVNVPITPSLMVTGSVGYT